MSPTPRQRVSSVTASLAVALTACLAPVGPDDVEVDAFTCYVHDGKQGRRPDPEIDLVAWVPTEEGWVERLPEKRADGAFVFRDVPDGRYLVRRGNTFYDTAARTLELAPQRLGEPTQGMPGSAKLAVEAKNARFYQGPATLCLTSVRAGLSGLCFGWQEDPYAALLAVGLELTRATRNLPNADVIRRGDDVIVHQLDLLTFREGPVRTTYSAARAFSTWDFDMTAAPQGTEVTLQGEMYALRPYPFNSAYDRAAFEALAPEVHPLAEIVSHQPTVEGAVRTPDGPRHLGNAPLLFAAVLAPGDTPVSFEATYGNPLGRTWERFVRATTLYARDYALGDGTSRPHTQLVAADVGELEARDLETLTPAVSPARDIFIDDQPFAADATVSVTPRLAWATPRLGTIASYELAFFELTDDGFQVRSSRIATFHTRETSLQLPGHVLTSGRRYHAVLTARNGDAVNVDRAAWHALERFPFGSAPAMSGVLTVE